MMAKLEKELAAIKTGRVLDIATRRGDFAINVVKGLGAFTEMKAIDIDRQALDQAAKYLSFEPRIGFELRDAYHTGYPDASFDMVTIGNSLHHFADLPALLREIKRIMKPDGRFLISEMTEDGQEGASSSHALLHRWDSSRDQALGMYHRYTYSQREVLEIVQAGGFEPEKYFMDHDDEPGLVVGLEKRIQGLDKALEDAGALPNYDSLVLEAAAVKKSREENGLAFARSLIVFARAKD